MLAAISKADESAREYLRANRRVLTILCDSLSSIAFLFTSENSELHAQTASSAMSLLLLYRDYPALLPIPWRRRAALLVLTILKSLQLVIEMILARKNSKPLMQLPMRLGGITAIEFVKAIVKLILLADRPDKGKPLMASDEVLPESAAIPECTCGLKKIAGSDQIAVKHGSRTNRIFLSALNGPKSMVDNTTDSSSDAIVHALFTVAYERRSSWFLRVFVSNECEACSVAHYPALPKASPSPTIPSSVALTRGEVTAEVLYIIRPVLHLLLIRRYGWRSWRAWMCSFGVDIGVRMAMAKPKEENDGEERRRRMMLMLLYLCRSPMFDMILGRLIKRLAKSMRWIPLLGSATSAGVDWVLLLQQYWFWTSGT